MLDNDLVSIIAPCYNGEQYVTHFLESILAQKYPFVELIFVDDGSTDKTKDIVLSYTQHFAQRSYSLQYVYQENNGQASAINRGLPLVKGSFVMWMDSDDILLPDALTEKVTNLKQHPEYGFNICEGIVVSSDDISQPIGIQKRDHGERPDNLFHDLLFEDNVIFTPAAYMTRTEVLRSVIPEEGIFESKAGQNWQLLLPLAYSEQYGYIDKPLYKYVVRSNSHSRLKRDYQQLIERYDRFQELQVNTIDTISSMSQKQKAWWSNTIANHISQEKIKLALKNYKFKDWLLLYKQSPSFKYFIENNPVVYYPKALFNKITRRH